MKIFISGIVASGKTTLAKKLSASLNIPCYEGDSIAWGFPDEKRYKRTYEEQAETIKRIDQKGDWIIEGTNRESQKMLHDMADRIFFLDTPLYIRKYRIIVRWIKQKLGLEKCNYKPDIKMLKQMFIWTNNFEKKRDEYEKYLSNYQDKLIWVHSVKELEKIDLSHFP